MASASVDSSNRPHDIIVFGCTGNAGRGVTVNLLKLALLLEKSSERRVLRIGLAGRSRDRVEQLLESVCRELEIVNPCSSIDSSKVDIRTDGGGASSGKGLTVAIKIADSTDEISMRRMTQSTHVLIACAGPFGRCGEAVVKACVTTGTHYCDITGEVPWVNSMIRKYNAEAIQKGVTLCPFSGYDCLPAELGMYLVGKGLRDQGKDMTALELAFTSFKAGAPHGTLNTVLDAMQPSELKNNFAAMRADKTENGGFFIPKEWFATAKGILSPVNFLIPRWSSNLKCFTGLNYMCPINVLVLCRSAAELKLHNVTNKQNKPFTIADRLVLNFLPPSVLNLYGLGGILLYTALLVLGGVAFGLALIPPVRKIMQHLLNTCYSCPGNKTGKMYLDAHGTSTNANNETTTASVHLNIPGDIGIYGTGLFAVSVAMAMLDATTDTVSSASNDSIQTGFHSPVAALSTHKSSNSSATGVGMILERMKQLDSTVGDVKIVN